MTKKLGAATKTELAAVDVRTTTFTGSAVDIKDYDSDLEFTQYSDQASASDILTGQIQHSHDGSTGWTNVANFVAVTDAASGFETLNLKAPALRRYIRYVGTIAGASPSFAFGAMMSGFKKAF